MRATYDHYGGSHNDIIKISSDSSTDSEPCLESDFNSSPESLVEMEDVASRYKPINGAMGHDPIGVYWLHSQKEMNGSGTLECVENMKQELLSKVKALGKELPLNTLDELIDYFGGPEKVAEMTGRKGRVMRRPDGSVVFESRAEQGLSIDHVNLKEKERFMNGDKVSAPEYIFLISELAGERRFASIVAKRLESLYGIKALDKVLRTIFQQTENKVPVPKGYQEGDAAFFSDLAPGIDEIYEESKEVFLTPGHPQDGQVVFYKWEEVYEKSLHLTGPNDGFYLSHKVRGNKYICLLAEQTRGKYFTLYKPNIGKQSQLEAMDSLFKKYQPVSPGDAQPHWESSYDFSLKHCNHAVWNRNCKVVQEGKECFQGTRLRHYYMLCGALLRVWTKIAGIMANITNTSYLQIVRLKTKEKKKQVGEWQTQAVLLRP
ncbi:hypothetical protein Chor_017247 [Crotalus horridus]